MLHNNWNVSFGTIPESRIDFYVQMWISKLILPKLYPFFNILPNFLVL